MTRVRLVRNLSLPFAMGSPLKLHPAWRQEPGQPDAPAYEQPGGNFGSFAAGELLGLPDAQATALIDAGFAAVE